MSSMPCESENYHFYFIFVPFDEIESHTWKCKVKISIES